MISALSNYIGTNGSAGSVVTPDFPTTLGSDVALWMNGRNSATKNGSGLFNSVTNGITSDDANAYSFAPVGSAVAFIKHSGQWLYADGSNQKLQTTEKTAFKFLHDGSNFELWLDVYVISATTGSQYPIISNSSGTSGETGITVMYDNRSAQSRTNALAITIGKSSAGNFVINAAANNALPLGQWNTIRIKRTGTTLTADVNGVNVMNVTNSNTPVTTDPSDGLALLGLSNSATYASNLLLHHVIAIKRNLTSQEATSMYSYMADSYRTPGSGQTAYTFAFGGQSNMLGQGTGAPPANLQKSYGTYQYNLGSDTLVEFSWTTTDFGPQLEFLNQVKTNYPSRNIFHSIEAVGGTYMYYTGDNANSWSTDAVGTGTRAKQLAARMVGLQRYLKYQLNMNMKVVALLWRQGETDALDTNPNVATGAAFVQSEYKRGLTNLYKYFLDQCATANIDTSLCRLISSDIDSNYSAPTRPYQSYIIAATHDVCNNFRTDNPTYSTKCLDGLYFSCANATRYPLSDGTHFTAVGQVSHGDDFWSTFAPYFATM